MVEIEGTSAENYEIFSLFLKYLLRIERKEYFAIRPGARPQRKANVGKMVVRCR